MCLLCDDDKADQAYMNYLDAMERQGKAAGLEAALNADFCSLAAAEGARGARDDPKNDKTLSPFICSPINK